MAVSIRTFRKELYEEHIQEASFLYEQRLRYISNDNMGWQEIANIEDRLEAHIDALVVGGDLALQICSERAITGDFGELFATVCVFCRQEKANPLSLVLQSLDYGDNEKVEAVADAMKYELPPGWSNFIEQALARCDSRLGPLLATVSGYRRLTAGPQLRQALIANGICTVKIINALGRLRVEYADEALETCLRDEDESIKSAALLAILQIGNRNVLQPYYAGASTDNWAHLALGLGGGRSAGNMLLEIAKSGKGKSDCLMALGLLGDPAALQTLYDCLKKPELADSAALALNWITGAQLFEEVFVMEAVREDELFESELKVWLERKEPPRRADGNSFGEKVKKLSTNKDAWKRWFADNASQIDPSLRYRNGKAYTPVSLLDNLEDERSDSRLRKFAAEEIVIRYGCYVPFEVDMPVAEQFRAIREMRSWVDGNRARFRPGQWYFAGKIVD